MIERVLPTHVGMSLSFTEADSSLVSAPHTRGDEPQDQVDETTAQECSPHTWG